MVNWDLIEIVIQRWKEWDEVTENSKRCFDEQIKRWNVLENDDPEKNIQYFQLN
jgi:hypothetical protein